MKTLRILLIVLTPCCLALCATSSQFITDLEKRAGKDMVKIVNAQLDKAERKAGL